MSELEKFLEGSIVDIGTIDQLFDYCATQRPLIAIQLGENETDGSKRFVEGSQRFVAFNVKGVEKTVNGFTPLPDGRIYDGSFLDGKRIPFSGCSFPLERYPVSVTKDTLNKGEVLVLRPESVMARYIQKFMESGRTEAESMFLGK